MSCKRFRQSAFALMVVLLTLAPASGYAQAADQAEDTKWDLYLPAGKGRELLNSLCTSCHDLGRIVSQRKDRKQWQQAVSGMLLAMDPRYADYLGDDPEKLTRYLAEYLGPLSPTYENLRNDSKLRERFIKGELKSVINVNTASINDLIKLPGISKDAAQAIIKYREENGPFKSTDDIKKVGSISEEQFKKMVELMTIN